MWDYASGLCVSDFFASVPSAIYESMQRGQWWFALLPSVSSLVQPDVDLRLLSLSVSLPLSVFFENNRCGGSIEC